MAIDPTAIGRRTEPVSIAWDARDTMLYAVSVGVGGDDPIRGLSHTTENTAGHSLTALPTMAVVLGGHLPTPPFGQIDTARLLHARQTIDWHRPIPAQGQARAERVVVDLQDKGHAAIAIIGTTLHLPDGAPLCTLQSSLFIRDHGGFGGHRGSAESWDAPQRAPDLIFAQRTQPNQALLYRLNGDRNPLHSDPAFAARGGLDRPILHGLCTMGFVAQGLIGRIPAAPESWKHLSVRFAAPVMPGDELVTSVWLDGPDTRFRTHVGDRLVLDQGLLRA